MKRMLIPVVALLLLGVGCEELPAQNPPAAVSQVAAPQPASAPVPAQVEGDKTLVIPVVPANQPSIGPPLAKVTKVVDGDTIDVSIDGKADKVRFIGINAPELSSKDPTVLCLADAAKKALADEIGTQDVSLESDATQYDRDKYERLLRYVVLPDGTNLNLWLVKEGYAYEYTYQVPYKYQAEFKAAQKDAEANKRGLWGDICASAAPTPATDPTPAPAAASPAPTFSCGAKTTCGQMSSCAEARYYLTQCGLTRLDGNHDGIPCETLCK